MCGNKFFREKYTQNRAHKIDVPYRFPFYYVNLQFFFINRRLRKQTRKKWIYASERTEKNKKETLISILVRR